MLRFISIKLNTFLASCFMYKKVSIEIQKKLHKVLTVVKLINFIDNNINFSDYFKSHNCLIIKLIYK